MAASILRVLEDPTTSGHALGVAGAWRGAGATRSRARPDPRGRRRGTEGGHPLSGCASGGRTAVPPSLGWGRGRDHDPAQRRTRGADLGDRAGPGAGRRRGARRHHRSAVNRADLMQRQGYYPPPPGAPPYPGLECSGRIAALGDGVTGWQVGDEVCALLAGGGYASRSRSRPASCCRCRPACDLGDAAGAARGRLHGLVERRPARPPEQGRDAARARRRLRHRHARDPGGQGARRPGRSPPPVRRRSWPAAASSAPTSRSTTATEDFVEGVREDDRRGADVILDNIGAKYLARNVDALAANGRLVVIGLQGGTKAELDLGTLLRKRAAVIATTLRARPAAGEGGDRGRGARATSGRWSRPARSARSSTACCRCPTPPRPTAWSRPASTSARCCCCRALRSRPVRCGPRPA